MLVRVSDFDKMILDGDNVLSLDPPYYAQGPSLYKHAFSMADHARLADLLSQRPRAPGCFPLRRLPTN